MKKILLAGLATGILALSVAGLASAGTIIDGSTQGFYNEAIGTSLNWTNPTPDPADNTRTSWLFPGDYQHGGGDPTFNPVPFAPDLSTASLALGDWLNSPTTLNLNWSFSSIPSTWTINDETAIIYKINAGSTGLDNVILNLGVDNGIFVWFDGMFEEGWLAPGGSTLGEYSLDFGSLTAGDHFLQILREDHGGGTGFNISMTGDIAPVPEPATMLLLGTGLAGLASARRKKKA